jgi:hypothetical protein
MGSSRRIIRNGVLLLDIIFVSFSLQSLIKIDSKLHLLLPIKSNFIASLSKINWTNIIIFT